MPIMRRRTAAAESQVGRETEDGPAGHAGNEGGAQGTSQAPANVLPSRLAAVSGAALNVCWRRMYHLSQHCDYLSEGIWPRFPFS
jgi:hypothetical protein